VPLILLILFKDYIKNAKLPLCLGWRMRRNKVNGVYICFNLAHT